MRYKKKREFDNIDKYSMRSDGILDFGDSR